MATTVQITSGTTAEVKCFLQLEGIWTLREYKNENDIETIELRRKVPVGTPGAEHEGEKEVARPQVIRDGVIALGGGEGAVGRNRNGSGGRGEQRSPLGEVSGNARNPPRSVERRREEARHGDGGLQGGEIGDEPRNAERLPKASTILLETVNNNNGVVGTTHANGNRNPTARDTTNADDPQHVDNDNDGEDEEDDVSAIPAPPARETREQEVQRLEQEARESAARGGPQQRATRAGRRPNYTGASQTPKPPKPGQNQRRDTTTITEPRIRPAALPPPFPKSKAGSDLPDRDPVRPAGLPPPFPKSRTGSVFPNLERFRDDPNAVPNRSKKVSLSHVPSRAFSPALSTPVRERDIRHMNGVFSCETTKRFFRGPFADDGKQDERTQVTPEVPQERKPNPVPKPQVKPPRKQDRVKTGTVSKYFIGERVDDETVQPSKKRKNSVKPVIENNAEDDQPADTVNKKTKRPSTVNVDSDIDEVNALAHPVDKRKVSLKDAIEDQPTENSNKNISLSKLQLMDENDGFVESSKDKDTNRLSTGTLGSKDGRGEANPLHAAQEDKKRVSIGGAQKKTDAPAQTVNATKRKLSMGGLQLEDNENVHDQPIPENEKRHSTIVSTEQANPPKNDKKCASPETSSSPENEFLNSSPPKRLKRIPTPGPGSDNLNGDDATLPGSDSDSDMSDPTPSDTASPAGPSESDDEDLPVAIPDRKASIRFSEPRGGETTREEGEDHRGDASIDGESGFQEMYGSGSEKEAGDGKGKKRGSLGK